MVFGIFFCNADGDRLKLNWNEGRLNCNYWNDDDDRNDNIGVFALMVGKRDKRNSVITEFLLYFVSICRAFFPWKRVFVRAGRIYFRSAPLLPREL